MSISCEVGPRNLSLSINVIVTNLDPLALHRADAGGASWQEDQNVGIDDMALDHGLRWHPFYRKPQSDCYFARKRKYPHSARGATIVTTIAPKFMKVGSSPGRVQASCKYWRK